MLNRVAVITGAASGIGLACSNKFAAAGARLVMADVNGEKLKAEADRLGAEHIAVDLTKREDCRKLADFAVERTGRADILLNILLIPSFGACGAAVSTAAAYAVTLLVQMIFLRKEINTIKIIRSFLPGVFFGCVMCACVFCISQTAINIMGKVLLELAVGVLVFTGLTGLWLYKTDDGLFKNLLSKVKERF